MEKHISRAYRNGISEKLNFREMISDRNRKLCKQLINNKDYALQELLPNKLKIETARTLIRVTTYNKN